jgi:preprotein translocase subunit SecG
VVGVVVVFIIVIIIIIITFILLYNGKGCFSGGKEKGGVFVYDSSSQLNVKESSNINPYYL